MKTLKDFLKPDARERETARQERLRERYQGRLAQTPAHANHQFGVTRADAALAQIEAAKGAPVPEAVYEQLAEGLALQGRFNEAAQVAPAGARKDDYTRKAEALERRNRRGCDCPDTIRTPGGRDAKGSDPRPARRPVVEAFDGRRFITIQRCDACGALWAQTRAAAPE